MTNPTSARHEGDLAGGKIETLSPDRMLVDFEQMRSDVAVHIYRQAEARLAAQAQLYTASITRSVTFSAIAVALGSIFLGLSLSEFNAIVVGRNTPTDVQLAMLSSFFVCAVLFLSGALLAFLACRATSFNIPGNPPKSLLFNKDYLRLKNPSAWDAFNLDQAITENHEILARKARFLTVAQTFTIFAPVLACVTFLLVVLIK
jgi:hypothetical protein